MFRHIELSSAPAFLLLIFSSIAFIISNFIFVFFQPEVLVAFSVILIIISCITYYLKLKTLAFVIISLAFGLVFYVNTHDIHENFPENTNKIIPAQKAIFGGQIEKIIKKEKNKSRYIITGFIDTKSLEKLEDCKIIVNIYGENKYNIGEKILCDGKIRLAKEKKFPDDFDEKKYLKNIGANWIGIANSKKTIKTKESNKFYTYKNLLYEKISKRINKLFSPITASLVSAILIADKSNLSVELREIFSLTGLAHILALSGLHIGIIASIIYMLLGVITQKTLIKSIIFSFVIVLYVVLVGAPESAMRAGAMVILYVFSRVFQREANPINIISIVVIVSVLIKPELIYSIAFQMSVLSVLSIFLFLPVFKVFFQNIFNYKKTFLNSLSVTLSASIIISPIVAYYFNIYSIVSPLANFFILPIFILGIFFSIVALFFSIFSFQVAQIYASAVEMIFIICVNITKYISGFKFSAILGEKLLLPSIIISISLIYIFSSVRSRQVIFRFNFVVLILFILAKQNFFVSTEIPKVEIYNKEIYCALAIPLENGEKFLWIADRKPRQTYYKDNGLINFILKNKVTCVGYNGEFGKGVVNSFTEDISNTNIKFRSLSFLEQRALEKKYLQGRYISQITN